MCVFVYYDLLLSYSAYIPRFPANLADIRICQQALIQLLICSYVLNTSTTRTMMCSTRMQVHVCFTNHGLITCQVWGDFVHHPMLLATSHASLRHLELPCAPLLPRRPPVCGFYCQSFPKHKWRRAPMHQPKLDNVSQVSRHMLIPPQGTFFRLSRCSVRWYYFKILYEGSSYTLSAS